MSMEIEAGFERVMEKNINTPHHIQNVPQFLLNKAMYSLLEKDEPSSDDYKNAIALTQKALEKSIKNGQRDFQVEAYYRLGNYYFGIKEFEKSVENYLDALTTIDKIRIETPKLYKSDYLDKNLKIYSELAFFYRLFKQYDKMIYAHEMRKSRNLLDELSVYNTSVVDENIVDLVQKALKPEQVILYYSFPQFDSNTQINFQNEVFDIIIIDKEKIKTNIMLLLSRANPVYFVPPARPKVLK